MGPVEVQWVQCRFTSGPIVSSFVYNNANGSTGPGRRSVQSSQFCVFTLQKINIIQSEGTHLNFCWVDTVWLLSPKLFVSHYWLCFTSKYSCSTQQILFSNNWHVATKAASSNPQSVKASSASCLASEKRLGVAGGYPLLFLILNVDLTKLPKPNIPLPSKSCVSF